MKSRPFVFGRLLLPAASLISFSGSAPSIFAANLWDGGGGNANWTTAGNWDDNNSATSGSGNDVHFAGTTGLTSFNDYSGYTAWRNILFDTGAGSFILTSASGANWDLHGKIENSSTNAQSITIDAIALQSASANEFDATAGNLTITAKDIYNNGNNLTFWGAKTLTVNNGGGSGISGLGKVILGSSFTGTAILTGSNAYTGNTEINSGTLKVGNSSGLGTSTVYVGNGGATGTAASLLLTGSGLSVTNNLNTNAGTNSNRTIGGDNTSGTNTFSGTLAMASGGSATLTAAAGGTVAFTGVISGTGQSITKTGLGTVTLSGSAVNTYTGGTKINGGVLNLDFSNLSGVSNLVASQALTMGGGTLSIQGKSATANTQAVTTLSNTSGTSSEILLTPGASGGTVGLTVANALAAPILGTLQLSATGSTTLSANLNSTFLLSGTVTFGTNNFAATSAGGLVSAAAMSSASANWITGVINDITGSFSTTGASISPLAIRFADATGRTASISTSTMTSPTILVASTAGVSALNGAGFLRSFSNGANRDFNVIQNSANDFSIGAPLSNPGSSGSERLVKSGTGRLILTNTGNSYSLGTYINEGIVSISANGNLGAVGGAVILNGGTLQSTAAVALDNGATFRGVTVNSNGGSLDALASGNTLTVGGIVTGAGLLSINSGVAAAGTLILSAGNNYSGGTVVKAGTLQINGINALGGANYGGLTLNGGTLKYATAFAGNGSGDLTSIGNVGITLASGGGTIDTNGNSVTYAGSIGNGGAGGLTKAGAGTLTLNGSDYTGGTTVNGGALVPNGFVAGATTVNIGGTLGGTATYSGTISVGTGGIIAPGNSVGTITTGGLTLGSGSILNFEFNTSPANDYINVTNSGGLTINGGGFNLYAEGTINAFSTVGSYNLIGYSGAIGGTGSSSLAVLNPQPGKLYGFGATGSNVTLDITPSGVISDWNVDADGSWNTAGNWTAAIPDVAGATANFNFPLTAARTVTLDGTKTVGAITFHPSSSVGYSIAAGTGGSLIIDNGLSQANMIVTTGANVISADVSLASSTTVASIAAATSLTLSGSVGGTGSLVKSGSGLLDLTNVSNGYAGNTTVSGGTLGFAALGSLGGGSLTIEGGSTLRYNPGNTADVSGKVVTVGVGGALIDTNGSDVIYANAIGNSGAGGFTKNGAGSLTMQGNNTFTGTTTISGGSVILTGTSASTGGTTLNGANTLLAISVDGGLGAVPGAATTNLTFNPGAGNSATLRTDAAITLNANRSISLASGTANIDSNGNNIVIAGNLSGSGLLKKIGAGNLTLSGTNSGTASGGMTIDAGTVFVTSQANLPSGTLTLNGTAGITSSNGGNFSPVVNGTNFITGTASVILGLGNLSGAGTLTFGGPFVNDYTGSFTAFTGTLIASGGGSRWNGSTGGTNLSLDLVNTGTSVRNSATGITIGALAGSATSTLTGAGGGATQAVTYTIGGKTVGGLGVTPVDSTFNGTITNGANTTGLTKVGASILTLTGANTFTGALTVNAGTLSAALGNNSTNPVSGALGNTQVARNMTINDTGTLRFDAGDVMGGADSTIVSTLVINSGGTVTNNGTSFNTLGAVTLNGGTLTGTRGTSNSQFQMYAFGGTVAAGGSAASTISSAAGTANGGTAIDTVGFHLGTGVATGTTFNVANATSSSASDLNVSAILIDRTGGLGAASLTKSGVGTMTLSGTNTYTGTTTVSNGTLLVNGNQSSATGAVSVASGATLGGTGTVGGATTISGTHNAGDAAVNSGVGSQAFSSTLSYASNSIFDWDINANSSATSFDTVSAVGDIDVSTTGTVFNVVFGAGVDLANSFWSTPDTTQTWSMISIFGEAFTSGSFASVTSTADPVTQGSFTINGSNLTWNSWSAVPEPTSALAGLLIGAGLLRRRRA